MTGLVAGGIKSERQQKQEQNDINKTKYGVLGGLPRGWSRLHHGGKAKDFNPIQSREGNTTQHQPGFEAIKYQPVNKARQGAPR
ncbi:unnamed protein product [Linum trigynum]|uniref:Uncharacterized protein n=1 Tax=Linum trigynum TaxID=586398 RepID=A0AAV2ERY0_9ROSI